MSSPTDCIPCCTTPVTTNIPGTPGAQGPAGTNGTNGINSYTVTTANFLTPATNASVTIQVASSAWAIVGEPVAIANGTNTADTYFITSVPDSSHITMTYLNYPSNANTGNTVNAGAGVSPTGFQSLPSPLAIANGGTGGTTKAAAQTALGLGQNPQISTVSGLTQAITGSLTQISGCAITIPAAGSWLYSAFAVVDWSGVTFASSRVVTLKVINTTQSTTVATGVWNTQVTSTNSYPSSDLHIPFVLYTAAAASDVLQLQIMVAVAPTAGTFQAISASLCAIPVRLT